MPLDPKEEVVLVHVELIEAVGVEWDHQTTFCDNQKHTTTLRI